MGNVSLQADICYVPSAVQENKGERPYFPRIYVSADQKSGCIVDLEVYQGISDDANVALNKLINICLEEGIPREIQVRSEVMAAILDDFCKRTGIKLKVVKRLSSIDHMIEEMAYRF